MSGAPLAPLDVRPSSVDACNALTSDGCAPELLLGIRTTPSASAGNSRVGSRASSSTGDSDCLASFTVTSAGSGADATGGGAAPGHGHVALVGAVASVGAGYSGAVLGRRGVTPIASAKPGGSTGSSVTLASSHRPPLSDRARSAGMAGRHGGAQGGGLGVGAGTPSDSLRGEAPSAVHPSATQGVTSTRSDGNAGAGAHPGAGTGSSKGESQGRRGKDAHAGPKDQGKGKGKGKGQGKSTSASPKVGSMGTSGFTKAREQRRPSASSLSGASGAAGGGTARPGLALHLGGLDSMLRGPGMPDHL